MQWNLHLVGEHLETELEDVLQKLITDLEGIGHTLTSATLTTDAGPKSLPTTPVPEPTQTVGGEPITPAAPVSGSTPAAPVEPTPAPADSTLPSDPPPPDPTVAVDDAPPSDSSAVATDTPPTL